MYYGTRRPPRTSLQNNSKAWTCLPSNGHTIKPFLRPTEQCSHSTRTRHRVDTLHTFSTPLLPTSQVIPKFACLPNRPRQTHSPIYIYVHPTSINNFYLISIELSATAYGRDIIHIYLLYMFHVVTVIILFCKH